MASFHQLDLGAPPSPAELQQGMAALRRAWREWARWYRGSERRGYDLDLLRELSRRDFMQHYRNQRPFVLRRAPAFRCVTRWTADYMRGVYARYCDDQGVLAWAAGTALVNQADATDPRTVDQNSVNVRATLDWISSVFASADAGGQPRLYFRGNALPELWADLQDLPDWVLAPDPDWAGADPAVSGVWSGLAGSRTLAHRDPWHGFLVQVRGRKRVLVVAPEEVSSLYLKELVADRSLPAVDFVAPDLARHPAFARVKVLEHVLVPGDLLYLPPFWFHDATCLDHAISVPTRVRASRVEALYHPIRIDNLMHGQPAAW